MGSAAFRCGIRRSAAVDWVSADAAGGVAACGDHSRRIGRRRGSRRACEEYAAQTDAELVATSRLIGSLYANMSNFPVFTALSLLYFAAASYSEAARRLGKSHLASSFLLCDHPTFAPDCDRACLRGRRRPYQKSESAELAHDILAAIEPFNVAGLGRTERRNWYPVDAADLFEGAAKLDATHDEIAQMLQRCGFSPEQEFIRG